MGMIIVYNMWSSSAAVEVVGCSLVYESVGDSIGCDDFVLGIIRILVCCILFWLFGVGWWGQV